MQRLTPNSASAINDHTIVNWVINSQKVEIIEKVLYLVIWAGFSAVAIIVSTVDCRSLGRICFWDFVFWDGPYKQWNKL